jgi:hypothetical protein
VIRSSPRDAMTVIAVGCAASDVRVYAGVAVYRSGATFVSVPTESGCGSYTRAKIANGQGLRHSPSWGSARRLPARLARGPSLP